MAAVNYLDILCLAYQGPYSNGSLLQVLDVETLAFQSNQQDGLGQGQFTIRAAYESQEAINIQAANRIDVYLRQDELAQAATSTATTITVSDGTRFKAGWAIAIYDGTLFDLRTISSVSGNVLTLNSGLAHSFGLYSSVMPIRYRGTVTTRERDAGLAPVMKVTTMGYCSQLSNFVFPGSVGTNNNKECGYVLYQVLQSYASQLDFTIDPTLITMSATGSLTDTAGTMMGFTGSSQGVSLQNLFDQIATTASGNTNGIKYAYWVDAANKFHFGPLPTTATVAFNINGKPTGGGTTGTNVTMPLDGIADVIGAKYIAHDNDMTGVVNTYYLTGGTDPSTQQPISTIVFDQNSVNSYTQIEATLSNSYITDATVLKNWGLGLLKQTAFPTATWQFSLSATRSFIDAQTCIKVVGFTDNSTETYNPQSVTTMWSSQTPGTIMQDIKGGLLFPDPDREIKQYIAEKYVANAFAPGSNLGDRFIQFGCIGSIAGNTFSMTAGMVVGNVLVGGTPVLTEFPASAYTFTMPATALSTVYTIAYLYRKTDGTQATTPAVVSFPGASASFNSPYTDEQVIPLWQITILNGAFVPTPRFIGNYGGVTTNHLVSNPNPTTAPVFAGGYTYASVTAALIEDAMPASTGISASITAQLTFGLTITNPNWLGGINLYAIPAGTTFAKPAGYKSTLAPSSNGVYTATIDGINPGANVDIYATFLDVSGGETPGLKVATATPAALSVGTVNQAGLPSLSAPNAAVSVAINSAPYVTSLPLLIVGSASSTTYDVQIPFFTDSVGTTNTTGLFEVQLMMRKNGATSWGNPLSSLAPVAPSTTSDGTNVGEYVGIWNTLGLSNNYDFGVRYIGHNGVPSATIAIWSNYSVALALPTSSLATMPGGTTISGALSGSLTYSGVGSAQYGCSGSVTITISDTNWAKWLKEIHILAKQVPASSTDGDVTASDFYDLFTIPASKYTGSGTPVPFTIPLGASNNNYEITLQAIDNQGKVVVATPFTVATSQQIGGATIVPQGINFVRDSAYTAGLTYFKNVGTPAITTYPKNNANTGNPSPFAGSPGTTSNVTGALYSVPFTPVAGATYTLSCGIGWVPVGGSGGTMHVGICDVSDYNAGHLAPTTIYGNGSDSAGRAMTPNPGVYVSAYGPGMPAYNWTCPGGWTTGQVCFVWWWAGINYAFSLEEPQIAGGSVFPGYVIGAVAGSDGKVAPQSLGDPTVNSAYSNAPHGAMSVQTNAVVGGTTGAPTLTVNPGGGVVGQLPIGAHDPRVNDDVTGWRVNLQPDSDLKFGSTYWSLPQTNGTTGVAIFNYWGKQAIQVYSGATPVGNNFNLTVSNPGTIQGISPNTGYTVSAFMDSSSVYTGSFCLIVMSGVTNTEIVRITRNAGEGASRISAFFNSPSGCTSIWLLLQSNITNANASGYVGQIQIEQGSTATSYKSNDASHMTGYYERGTVHPSITNVINSLGQIPISSSLNPQGSIIPVGIIGVSIGASNSSGVCSTTITWSSGTIYLPDGSTASITGSSHTDPSLSASTTYHYSVYVTVSGGVGTVSVLGNYGGNVAPSQAQKYQIYLDGRYGITEDVYITTPATSGGAPAGGGGGGGGSCPGADQLVRTEERGYIPARACKAGMHVMGPDGAWKKIMATKIAQGALFRVTVAGETYTVDSNHYWQGMDGEFVRVTDLTMDTLLSDANGKPRLIERIEQAGNGEFIKFRVEGAIFQLGDLVCHNLITL